MKLHAISNKAYCYEQITRPIILFISQDKEKMDKEKMEAKEDRSC